ncbi:hemerythrin domain-containing protein [Haliea sp. E1-2-M8]|uniref:hemerythrin domain-containing protein n=1 Tax=Haliea sp. E1-2-M8 TaxID=3064706 RepID=UPI00271A59FA|nr:hemerythrin domain-containing protein [Haliea sp. E1-2-M8]MDO8860485.1 hemerythrin domain-containing protein [Haliea sp. E1-2-M8]
MSDEHTRPPLITTLLAEHEHIARITLLMAAQLDAIESDTTADSHVLYEIMSYMVTWADRYHHPREDLIYGRAAELDRQLADDVDSLQRQHDAMAHSALALQELIAYWRQGAADSDAVVSAGRAYIDHSLAHMRSEEQLVFPRIESVLTPADWLELELDDRLQPATDPVFGPRIDREFRNLRRKLRRGARRRIEQEVLAEWTGLEAIIESMDVLGSANHSAAQATAETLRNSLRDSLRILRETPLTAAPRCAINNTRLGGRWLGTVVGIASDAMTDLARINRERRQQLEKLKSA